ncbi:MAG: hypothetical protein KF858_01590 [Candidatus Sumerlaeia bacterium]|nr:hypothetical protein [Candidatus Sumerlaeia bacterium]
MTRSEGEDYTPGIPGEIHLDADGPVDWAQALKELENYRPPSAGTATPPPVAASAPPAAPPPVRAPEPAPVLPPPPTPSAPVEEFLQDRGNRVPALDGNVAEDLVTILTAVNSAMQQLGKFQQSHPYLIAPNILRTWQDELKETSILMNREYRRLRNETVGDET